MKLCEILRLIKIFHKYKFCHISIVSIVIKLSYTYSIEWNSNKSQIRKNWIRFWCLSNEPPKNSKIAKLKFVSALQLGSVSKHAKTMTPLSLAVNSHCQNPNILMKNYRNFGHFLSGFINSSCLCIIWLTHKINQKHNSVTLLY